MTDELAPQYDPSAIERPLYDDWRARGLFHVAADGAGEPYVIQMPPPNVTAVLHAGHGLNNTLQDVLIRYQRMRGRRALWVPGTDHAGIATQNVVEKLLASEGKTRFDVGREAFVERVKAFVAETGGTILKQLEALGASCDWQRTYFTLDEGLSRAVREVFVTLYEQGLIYRGKYIINWCPRCLTALSNEEAEKEEVDGKIWHLRYPLADGTGLDRGGHHPPRDDARRHGGGGASRRRALRDDGRQGAAAATHRPADPGDRRRRGRGRFRHRRGEGDPGPRPDRLRDRPPARPAADRRDHR